MSIHSFEIEIKHHQGYSLEVELSAPWRDSGEFKSSDNYYDIECVWIYRNGKPLREKYNERLIKYLGQEAIDTYIDLAIDKAES